MAFEWTKREREEEYIYGKKYGKIIHWYSNGQKKSKEEYIDGKQNGKVIHWYSNGQKKSEEEYINGKHIGTQTFWYPNGKIQSQSEVLDRKKIMGDRKNIAGYGYSEKIIDNINNILSNDDRMKTILSNDGNARGKYLNGKKIGVWVYWTKSNGTFYKIDHDEIDHDVILL